MKKMQYIRFVWMFLISLALSGCTSIRLVSTYDEVTDKTLTELQKNSDDFIDSLIQKKGTPQASFASNESYYRETAKALRTLRFRVESIPGNELTTALVDNISNQIHGGNDSQLGDVAGLKGLHQAQNQKRPFAEYNNASLTAARSSINSSFRAALQLELAKKRGVK